MVLLILLAAVISLIVIVSVLLSYIEAKTWENARRERQLQANKRIDFRA